MRAYRYFPFYPERLLWKGGAILTSSILVAAGVVWVGISNVQISQNQLFRSSFLACAEESPSLFFCKEERGISSFPFPMPRVSREMTFSAYASRPGSEIQESGILVCCKPSSQSRRVSLPCRLSLQYQVGDRLGFADDGELFWIDLSREESGKISAVVCVETPDHNVVEAERFVVFPEEHPVTFARDWTEGTPVWQLAQAAWVGKDLLAEKYFGTSLQRIRIDRGEIQEMIDLSVGDWLVWNGAQWKKGLFPEDSQVPIAKVGAVDARGLILEGWDKEAQFRVCLPVVGASHVKIRPEEMLHSIRVRSDRQISCMMEKQCLILRCGDWVLKTDGKWKVLRRAEEKNAYRSGKLSGELFVLEKIDVKQGLKRVQGVWFNPERTQLIPVDAAVNAPSGRSKKERF